MMTWGALRPASRPILLRLAHVCADQSPSHQCVICRFWRYHGRFCPRFLGDKIELQQAVAHPRLGVGAHAIPRRGAENSEILRSLVIGAIGGLPLQCEAFITWGQPPKLLRIAHTIGGEFQF